MKIKEICICGFRGFNESKELVMDDRLTIIYGPNSYGKTSISEALEWLLLGDTSKVENSLSGKNEYKGSYRNIHFPSDQCPCIEVTCLDQNGEEFIIRGELRKSGETKKFIDDEEVNSWPWENPELKTYSPFILQHALQDLLLTSPTNRYDKFSKILGTQSLTELQNIFNSLATKYHLPDDVADFETGLSDLVEKVNTNQNLVGISRAINKFDQSSLDKELDASIRGKMEDQVIATFLENGGINPEAVQLLEANRKEEISSIFDKKLLIESITSPEQEKFDSCKKELLDYITNDLIDEYLGFIKLKTQKALIERARFHKIGVSLLRASEEKCPFCATPLTTELKKHIQEKHTSLQQETSTLKNLTDLQKDFLDQLGEIRKDVKSIRTLLQQKVADFLLLNNDDDKVKIREIFGVDNSNFTKITLDVIEALHKSNSTLTQSAKALNDAFDNVEKAFETSTQNEDHLQELNEGFLKFIADSDAFLTQINTYDGQLQDINEKFDHRLNTLAGTQTLAIQIDLLKNYSNLKKLFRIKQAVASLKDLRAQVTKYINTKTKTIIEEQLTDNVMTWYNQIKTSGDPDVHFSGFALAGTVANQRIGVKATSYGQELVSAVSSLSESKLNALGLSIKIANNLKGNPPFGFIIIDDPVQSLDNDHSTQFSEIIRRLIEQHNKQIILLSHNIQWLRQVKKGNESINGIHYEITGYSQQGPHISPIVWKEWRRRLDDVIAICNNPNASKIQLQQAEQEIRLSVSEIACRIYEKKTGKCKNASKMNERSVRKLLLESGVRQDLVDKIGQTFTTTDDSHHAPENYDAVRQRIKQYHSWVHELSRHM